tara:strand:- start:83 stop:235 length:153 start_codon:yes stop_codon:yes gene_type:complete
MRHFKTKFEAKKWRDQKAPSDHIFKKIKGQKNRLQKPFVVGSEMGFLNLY